MADNAPKTGIQNIGSGDYQIPLNKVAGWNRQTIADGMWLNNNTIYPLAWNEMVLASGINYTSAAIDYTSAELEASAAELHQQIFNSSSYLQSEVDLMRAATDVVAVFPTKAAFDSWSATPPEWLTDMDVIKILHDESRPDDDQVYYQSHSAEGGNYTWDFLGSLDPYYNTTEIDEFLRWTSADYVRDTVSADLYNKLKTSADTLHAEIDTVSGDLYSKLSTSASTLHQEINTVSSKLQTEVEWTSAALQTSASKLKNEINFTSSWLDKAYAVNGSEFIKVTSGADVFGEQQTFTVDFKDHPLTMSGADEDVQVFESADCALISAYPWKVFYATPNVTTFEEIKAAHEKGLQVVVIENGRDLFRLTAFDATHFNFNRTWEDVVDYGNGDILPFEAWECRDSYGETYWQKLVGDGDQSVPKYLATTEYVSGYANDTSAQILQWIQTSASQASANALSKAESYANNASGNAYTKAEDLIRNCSGKTEVSGSLFIKSSVSRSGDKNIYTEELDTGKFHGTNINIASGTNGLTFSAKNYDQAILDTSSNAYNKSESTTRTVSGDLYETIQNHSGARVQTVETVGGDKDIDSIKINKNGTSHNLNAVSARKVGSNTYSMMGYLVPGDDSNNKCLRWDNTNKTPKWDLPNLGSYTQYTKDGNSWEGDTEELNSFEVNEFVGGNTRINFKSKQTTSQNLYLVPAPVANKALVADSAGVMKWDNVGGTKVGGYDRYGFYQYEHLVIDDQVTKGLYTDPSDLTNPIGYIVPKFGENDAGKFLRVNNTYDRATWDDATTIKMIEIPYTPESGTVSDLYSTVSGAIRDGYVPVLYTHQVSQNTDNYEYYYLTRGFTNLTYTFESNLKSSDAGRGADLSRIRVEKTNKYYRDSHKLQDFLARIPADMSKTSVLGVNANHEIGWINSGLVTFVSLDTSTAWDQDAYKDAKAAYDAGYLPIIVTTGQGGATYYVLTGAYSSTYRFVNVQDNTTTLELHSDYTWELNRVICTSEVQMLYDPNSWAEITYNRSDGYTHTLTLPYTNNGTKYNCIRINRSHDSDCTVNLETNSSSKTEHCIIRVSNRYSSSSYCGTIYVRWMDEGGQSREASFLFQDGVRKEFYLDVFIRRVSSTGLSPAQTQSLARVNVYSLTEQWS